jgi:hypothetical protein
MTQDYILKNATDEELASAVEENVISTQNKIAEATQTSAIFIRINYALLPSISKPGIREARSSQRNAASNR